MCGGVARWVQNGNVVVSHAGGSGVEYGRMVDEHYSVILLADCPGTTAHSFALGRLACESKHGPLRFVGHSFGASIAGNFATTCQNDVAGLVFVDGVCEEQRFDMWNKSVLVCGFQGSHFLLSTDSTHSALLCSMNAIPPYWPRDCRYPAHPARRCRSSPGDSNRVQGFQHSRNTGTTSTQKNCETREPPFAIRGFRSYKCRVFEGVH
jgi:hypothetical protein